MIWFKIQFMISSLRTWEKNHYTSSCFTTCFQQKIKEMLISSYLPRYRLFSTQSDTLSVVSVCYAFVWKWLEDTSGKQSCTLSETNFIKSIIMVRAWLLTWMLPKMQLLHIQGMQLPMIFTMLHPVESLFIKNKKAIKIIHAYGN